MTARRTVGEKTMKLLRFTLGVRFDMIKDRIDPEDVDAVLSELTQVLTTDDVEGLHVYGGEFDPTGKGEKGVYTALITNGSIKRMKNIYNKLDSDARIHAMLEPRTPYLQNNVLRNAEGLEFFGIVGRDGVCTGGSGRRVAFAAEAKPRSKYSDNKTIIIAPNAFKGTIPGTTAARRLVKAIRKTLPEITCVPVPIADGGDGTLDAIENAVLGQRHGMSVTDPCGGKIKAEYYVIDGTKAVIESALASGLALLGEREPDILNAQSTGTGELILRAAHEGVRNIFVCLGGSATNDCGLGLARAVGVRFLDAEGNEVVSAGELANVASIDVSNADEQVLASRITAMCDVDNPLTGSNGATFVFGPQKGAGEKELEILEKGLINMGKLLDAHAGRAVSLEPGAGAAGGMGAMLKALFGAETVSGAEAVLDIAELDVKLKNAAVVITGEGRIDSTTMNGKAVGAVMDHAERAGVPVALIVGSRGDGAEAVESRAKFVEITGSEEDALTHFDAAAERLAEKLAGLFR